MKNKIGLHSRSLPEKRVPRQRKYILKLLRIHFTAKLYNTCISNLPLSPDRKSCEPCPDDNYIVNLNGKCEECPEGLYPNGYKTSCSQCRADEVIDFDGLCQKCQDGFVPVDNRKFCTPCPKGFIATGGICALCPTPKKQ